MTISPPAKIAAASLPVYLNSGIDTLEMSIDVCWAEHGLLEELQAKKAMAQESGKEMPCELAADGQPPWRYNLLPYGAKGYEWLLNSADINITLGNWLTPQSRPSANVKLSAEYLASTGVAAGVERVLALFRAGGGDIIKVRVSRADLFLDMLLPEALWSDEHLKQHRVSRAKRYSPEFDNDTLKCVYFGRGDLICRLYDKVLEIAKSGKTWVFDTWTTREVPGGEKAIRVEYQLRRQVLKELGVDTFDDLLRLAPHLWSYCTRSWLKFEDHPGLQSTQRSVLPWWEFVQTHYLGIPDGVPAVRVQAAIADRERLISMIMGYATSYYAMTYALQKLAQLSFEQTWHELWQEIALHGWTRERICEEIERKKAKYKNRALQAAHGMATRKAVGLTDTPAMRRR